MKNELKNIVKWEEFLEYINLKKRFNKRFRNSFDKAFTGLTSSRIGCIGHFVLLFVISFYFYLTPIDYFFLKLIFLAPPLGFVYGLLLLLVSSIYEKVDKLFQKKTDLYKRFKQLEKM